MTDLERPSHGARFGFELLEAQGARARYRVTVAWETAQAEAEAIVTDSSTSLGAFDTPPEAWAAKSALAFLEVLQRGYDEEAGWPRRLQRWRQQR